MLLGVGLESRISEWKPNTHQCSVSHPAVLMWREETGKCRVLACYCPWLDRLGRQLGDAAGTSVGLGQAGHCRIPLGSAVSRIGWCMPKYGGCTY